MCPLFFVLVRRAQFRWRPWKVTERRREGVRKVLEKALKQKRREVQEKEGGISHEDHYEERQTKRQNGYGGKKKRKIKEIV